MDVTALMNQPGTMNASYISKNLTNAAIFPESAELPYLDTVNQQELWRTGIFLNQYFMRFENSFLNECQCQPWRVKTINNCF